jgi:hypothetical protein
MQNRLGRERPAIQIGEIGHGPASLHRASANAADSAVSHRS